MQIGTLLQQQLQMQQLRNSFESHGTATNHPHNLYVSTIYISGWICCKAAIDTLQSINPSRTAFSNSYTPSIGGDLSQ